MPTATACQRCMQFESVGFKLKLVESENTRLREELDEFQRNQSQHEELAKLFQARLCQLTKKHAESLQQDTIQMEHALQVISYQENKINQLLQYIQEQENQLSYPRTINETIPDALHPLVVEKFGNYLQPFLIKNKK